MAQFRIISISLLFIAVTVVSLQGQKSDAALATIYFYQRSGYGRIAADVYFGNKPFVQGLRQRSYSVVQCPAGALQLRTSGRPRYFITEKTFLLEVEAKQTYFIEVVMDYDFLTSSFYLVRRAEADFLGQQKKLRPHEAPQPRVVE
ncbi:MAG: hypothetical protein R2795_19695 [Saprospiraceae bacterium]